MTLLAASTALVACSSDDSATASDGDGGPGPSEFEGTTGTLLPEPCPTGEPVTAGLQFSGGTAVLSEDGIGGKGGRVELLSSGPIFHETDSTATSDPELPTPPSGGVSLTASDLGESVTRAETLRLSGIVRVAGAAPLLSITSTQGDIVIDGVLRVENSSDASQELALSAPSGTVFISGVVDTSSTGLDGAGQSGGIRIAAQSIVIDGGTLWSTGRGPCSGRGGSEGGAIALRASAGPVHFTSGTLDSRGGAGYFRGYDGGDIVVESAAAVLLDGTIMMSGGSSEGSPGVGGAGGHLWVNAPDQVRVAGAVHSNGGSARGGPTPGGAAETGGIAGSLHVGAQTRPTAIRVVGPMQLFGGDGNGKGGAGGVLDLQAKAGDIQFAGTLDVSGGGSQQQAGNAGTITAVAGHEMGGIFVTGRLAGHGGAELSGGQGQTQAQAGAGAFVDLRTVSLTGPVEVVADAEVAIDGGQSASGRAGAGGVMDFRSRDGNISIGGTLMSRGGSASASGGHGGAGGAVYIWTDTNFNGIGGDLTVEVTGLIDVSGGEGSVPGSARNNGTYGIALFPVNQHQIAVLLNSETISGPPVDGQLVNHGMIIARGGVGGGFGGDVMFHGRRPGSNKNPEPGMMDLRGDGMDGDFVAE